MGVVRGVYFSCDQYFFTHVMTRKKGKKRNRGRRRHRRSQQVTAQRRQRGRERLRRALRGLLARRPVRRVLLGTAANFFFRSDVPEALAPRVLHDAALDIAQRLHGKPA